MPDPLSIRTNNPGAQWMGPVARQYGATGAEAAAGGNNAAVFPDPVSGAAAHFGLLNKNYLGMPLDAAISKWSGGNSAPDYTQFVAKVAGLAPDAVLSHEVLSGPTGIALTKAQARWEAGKDYPLSDEQWGEAQRRVFGGAPAAPAAAPVIAQAPAQAAPAGPAGDSSGESGEAVPSPSVQGMIDPNEKAWGMFQKFGGGRGILNGQQAEAQAPQMMRLRNAGGTPMAQQMRQSLLANILRKQ